ncbi:MAG: FHA domain-containing protein [Saprospiraceae bacterium]|nr:FHA domain-containing protein [Pyrinomonadaceae bacterium]
MSKDSGKFRITFADAGKPAFALDQESIFIGRLKSCDIVLEHKSVSRIHAGINFLDSNYFLINLSTTNTISLNGRPLKPQRTDVVADGDIIQIGPFALAASVRSGEIGLQIHSQLSGIPLTTNKLPPVGSVMPHLLSKEYADVLKVFWEKRTREKEDWGTLLRPTQKPQPGKAVINWKPTRDLQKPWRAGLFIWAFLIVGAIGAFAFFRYPQTFASKPLATPHSGNIEGSLIANQGNGNSCTTCHTLNGSLETACIKCHQAEQFHASNVKAHQEAGVTCTVCHAEHQGADFQMRAAAVQTCAQCHNNENLKTYNGKTVRTAHGGSYGYPIENGVWKWKGLYRETAETIPEINGAATNDETEQAFLSRQFHSIHVSRLNVPDGLKGDKYGLVSCSTCHKSFEPVDRETPRQTCAACHVSVLSARENTANCISCHVQHPYSGDRWSGYLRADALTLRREAIGSQIKRLNEK